MANLYPKITKDLTALANKFNDMSIYPVNAQDYKDLFFIIRQLGLDVSSLTPSSTTPTLDQVTTAGNTTANTIDIGGVTTDYVQLDTAATPVPVAGMLYWDQDEETAGLQVNGLNYEIGQGLYWVGKNQTGVQINKGTAVYASGTLGASGRILIAPMIADGSIEAKYFLGITAEDIADGDDGKVITQGKVRQIDTTGYGAAGNVLWVSPTTAGALTQTQPTGTDLALAVAFVVHYASNGVLAVRVSVLDENSIGVIPTLDQVTTAGNTTGNGITIGSLHVNGGPITNYNQDIPDIGAVQTSDFRGYGDDYIAEKTLAYTRIGSQAFDEEGAIRIQNGVFQTYVNGGWSDVATGFRFRQDPNGNYEFEHKPTGFNWWIEVSSGNSDILGLNGLPLVQNYAVSMGAYPVPLEIDGGTF